LRRKEATLGAVKNVNYVLLTDGLKSRFGNRFWRLRKPETRVRFPSPAQLIINDLQSSAVKVL